MITQTGRINIENYKKVMVKQNEEVEGVTKEVEKEITVRFDLNIPMGAPYELIKEALGEYTAEIEQMEKDSKERADKAKEAVKE